MMKRFTHLWNLSQTTVWPGAVFFMLGAFSLFSMYWGHGADGIATVGAERVLSGEVPYRDFWTMYAPGQFYFIAFLYSVFGTHALVSIIAASIISALSVALVYRVAFLLFHQQLYASVCALIFIAAYYYKGYYMDLGSYPSGLFFILIALNLYVNYLRDPHPILVPLTGLMVGVAAIFKHDVGAYLAISIGTGLLVYHLCRSSEVPGRSLRLVIKVLLWFGVSAAVPVLLTIMLLAPYAGSDMLQDLILFPATDFPFTRPEAYPGISPAGLYHPHETRFVLNLAYYFTFNLPLLFWVSGTLASIIKFRNKDAVAASAGATFAIAYLFHYWAAQTQINTHIISMSLYGVLMACLTASLLQERLDWQAGKWGRAFAAILITGWIASITVQRAYSDFTGDTMVRLDLPRVRGINVKQSDLAVLHDLNRFVRQNVPVYEPVYIGLNRHDALITSGAWLYFLLDRSSATRYHELHPGIVDTLDVQREMIRDISEHGVRLVVLWKPFSDKHLDKWKRHLVAALPGVGATELDKYLARHFVKVARFGKDIGGYTVMVRRPPSFKTDG